jgi:hypothetical protein
MLNCLAKVVTSSAMIFKSSDSFIPATKSTNFLPDFSWITKATLIDLTRKSATISICSSFMPLVVRAGVPNLIPPGLTALQNRTFKFKLILNLRFVSNNGIFIGGDVHQIKNFFNFGSSKSVRSQIPHDQMVDGSVTDEFLSSVH